MSYYLEHKEHPDLLASTMADISRQEEDIFLISTEGHRIYTSELLLRINSPLLCQLLDSLPSSPSCPGLSLPLLPASSLRHLLLILQRGSSSAQTRGELMAVEEAAVSLGVSLPNCVLVSRGASRRGVEAGKAVAGLKISKVGSEEGKEEQKKLAGKYRCQVCDFTSNLPSQVKEHGRTDHLGKVFVCPKCKKRYSKKRVLKRHLEEKHGDGLEVKAEPGTQEDTINDMADKTREDNSVKVKKILL